MMRGDRFGQRFDVILGIFATAFAWVVAAAIVAWCVIALVVGTVIVARRIAEVMS